MPYPICVSLNALAILAPRIAYCPVQNGRKGLLISPIKSNGSNG